MTNKSQHVTLLIQHKTTEVVMEKIKVSDIVHFQGDMNYLSIVTEVNSEFIVVRPLTVHFRNELATVRKTSHRIFYSKNKGWSQPLWRKL